MKPLSVNLRAALTSLHGAWQRNLLSLVGLVIGIGAVVAMLALALIVRHEALRQFKQTGLDVIAIRQISGAGKQVTLRPPVIDLDLAQGLVTAVPGLERVAPILAGSSVVGFEGRQIQTSVLGVTADFMTMNNLAVTTGRPLTALDAQAPYAVVGGEMAASLLGQDNRPLTGRQLVIAGKVITIIGVLAPARSIPLHDGDLNKTLLIPAQTYSRIIDDKISVIYAQHQAGVDTGTISDAAASYFQTRVTGLAVQVTSATQVVREMERQLRLFALFFGATGTLALVLGGAGIMNSLLLAVTERRREIGLRRALGALRADIQSQFLQEAVILCGTGGVLGVVAGAVVTWFITLVAGWEFMLPPATLVLGVGVSVTIGVVAGFFPAYQAARLDPVVAMKTVT